MTISVLFDYYNAILSLPITSSETEENPFKLMVPKIKIVEVKGVLKPGKRREDKVQEKIAGQDINRILMSGWLVSPVEYPAGCSPPFECDMIYINLGKEQKGRFHSIPEVSGPFVLKEQQEILGTPISGWFFYG